MIFFKKNKNPHINCSVKLRETDILPSPIVQISGYNIGPQTFRQHMTYAINKEKKLNSILSALRTTWWGASLSLLFYIYNSMIQISFEYASLVFALNNNQDLEKLQKIQNQALRLSYGYRVSTSINICMLNLNSHSCTESRIQISCPHIFP